MLTYQEKPVEAIQRTRVVFSVQKVSNGYIIEIEAQNYVFTDLIGVNNFIADWFDKLEWKSNVG